MPKLVLPFFPVLVKKVRIPLFPVLTVFETSPNSETGEERDPLGGRESLFSQGRRFNLVYPRWYIPRWYSPVYPRWYIPRWYMPGMPP